jgi:site-specific recombinase XerD
LLILTKLQLNMKAKLSTHNTNLAEGGVGVHVLMALAGHSNLATTQRYIEFRPAMLKRQFC